MIIIAAAIILSLNGNNIIGRANEAKTASDIANKKETVNVLLSEYYINVAKGKFADTTPTADEYVKKQLQSKRMEIDDVKITEDGNAIVGAGALFINNNIPIGAQVEGYKLNNTT